MKKILFLIIIIFNSCSSEPDYEKHLSDMGINLSESYTVLESESNSAIGDYSINFDLKISKNDFETIKKKVKETENYQELNVGESPNDYSTFSKYDKVRACKSGKNYYYSIDKAKSTASYFLILSNKNELSLTYVEE